MSWLCTVLLWYKIKMRLQDGVVRDQQSTSSWAPFPLCLGLGARLPAGRKRVTREVWRLQLDMLGCTEERRGSTGAAAARDAGPGQGQVPSR
jgi:hypothetical protein